jgi:hypothetical protein
MAKKTLHNRAKFIESPQDRTDDTPSENKINIAIGRTPSLTDDVMLEFGKKLIFDSIILATEFNKTMLGLTATFATLMASFFSLLAFGSMDYQLDNFQRVFLAVPVILMLFSSICFSFGFLPQPINMNLNIINSIEEARNRLIRTKKNFAISGIILFCLSIILLICEILFFNFSK